MKIWMLQQDGQFCSSRCLAKRRGQLKRPRLAQDDIRGCGANVVEVQFDREAEAWKARLEQLDGVTSVQPESAGFYRVITTSGSRKSASREGCTLSSATMATGCGMLKAIS